ncbi:hypothetical protein [Nostoc sp. 'Lobaria pulmonaria (5183) cyanobiont']|uniref:hypothetical protein n=1 Tax=Nostoc sp. 'Lobaria pulmonaria (5183) cyanobiont' TaxID=1618022 RepID=UPI00131A3C42|nr:hypothetical protein [Nostoc sp. 'Lobaria pulmonaria (5183) cyanobiont']
MKTAVVRFCPSTIANSWYREEMSGKRSLLESQQQANICDRLQRALAPSRSDFVETAEPLP